MPNHLFDYRRNLKASIKTKFHYLIEDAVITPAEFAAAKSKGGDIERVLLDEYNVGLPAMGRALSKFFGVPYESYKPGRAKPVEIYGKLTRTYVESHFWVPIEASTEGLVILSTDPEHHHNSGAVAAFYPHTNLLFRVCTQREFKFTLDQLYGPSSASATSAALEAGLNGNAAFDGWYGNGNSAVNQEKISTYSGVESLAVFTRNLAGVTDKIQSTQNFDEIMQEISNDICALFDADRLSLYEISDDKLSMVSKIQTGLRAFEAIRLPVSELSIAGYAALTKKMLNIADAYNKTDLSVYSPNLQVMRDIDRRTGYRTKQILVAPILDRSDCRLLGVLQLINNKTNRPFPVEMESGMQKLAEVLAVALRLCP